MMQNIWGKFFASFVLYAVCLVLVGRAQAATINVPGDHTTIQAAINAAAGGDTVLVDDGIYTENIDFLGRAITVKSVNGAASTTIDGNQNGSVVTFDSSEGADSVLDGFTITNGNGTYKPLNGTTSGGGIYCDVSSSPTITNCNISGNVASNSGGGIFCCHSTITNCTISGNLVTEEHSSGGGIFCSGYEGSPPTITNCTITGNMAYLGGGIGVGGLATIVNCFISSNTAITGGGIGLHDSFPYDHVATISNCTIINNIANAGGGISCPNASPTITNCTISKNTALETENIGGIGGGICFMASLYPTVINCTISSNTATNDGGGIYCGESSSAMVFNSILWWNTAGGGSNEIYKGETSSITVNYSDIQGGWTGSGNINEDPLFMGGGDYHLSASSPCIDVGTATDAPVDDIDGDTRPQGAGYDMGADEYTASDDADGDVNEDGNITPQDALMVFQQYLGLIQLNESQLAHADVNNDGNITPADALCIFQKYLGLSSCLD